MKTGMEVELDEENIEETGGMNEGGPGRKEPDGKVEDKGNRGGEKRGTGKAKKPRKKEGTFRWTSEQDAAFNAVKHVIANNAMAPPDAEQQYQLAVDASKRGIGGVLFQLDNVKPHVEANNSVAHRDAERIIMFISFKLEDPETRYSNSEREALTMVRCLAEVKWMVVASEYPTLVYTDHEALKVLLTGLDNDAHGRIAKWQERLGEHHFRLIHRAGVTHFMGIADGLSRLPTALMQCSFAEDSEGLRPTPIIVMARQHGINYRVWPMARLATRLRYNEGFWGVAGSGEAWVGVLVEQGVDRGGTGVAGLEAGAKALRRKRWKRWLGSEFYGDVVRVKLDGLKAREKMDLGRNEWRALMNRAKRYVMVEGGETKLFWKEKDRQLALCILEGDVGKVLGDLHDGNGHFAAGITGGRAHGRFFWPTQQKDIRLWVASCEPCQ